jgi:hypothetical protein
MLLSLLDEAARLEADATAARVKIPGKRLD